MWSRLRPTSHQLLPALERRGGIPTLELMTRSGRRRGSVPVQVHELRHRGTRPRQELGVLLLPAGSHPASARLSLPHRSGHYVVKPREHQQLVRHALANSLLCTDPGRSPGPGARIALTALKPYPADAASFEIPRPPPRCVPETGSICALTTGFQAHGQNIRQWPVQLGPDPPHVTPKVAS